MYRTTQHVLIHLHVPMTITLTLTRPRRLSAPGDVDFPGRRSSSVGERRSCEAAHVASPSGSGSGRTPLTERGATAAHGKGVDLIESKHRRGRSLVD